MEAGALNILIAEPRDYSAEALKIYASTGIVYLLPELNMPLEEAIANVHTLVIRLQYQIDASLLEKAPHLKFIISPTTGLDHIDETVCVGKGINIISLRGETDFLASIPSTAEFTWGLLLSLTRRIPTAATHVTNGGWDRNLFKGHNLRGKKLGILGLGRVGRQVAQYAKVFGMEIMAYDPFINDWVVGVEKMESAASLFMKVDIVSIHIPVAGNNGFVSAELLNLMQPGALLINTSRGSVWNEAAVAELLESRHLGGVATDVLNEEMDVDSRLQSPLLALSNRTDNLIITPHIAGATYESMAATEIFVAEKWRKEISLQVTE